MFMNDLIYHRHNLTDGYLKTKTPKKKCGIMANEGLFILTNVLWGATCGPVLLPLMKMVSQAKVDEFDVGVW